MNLPRGLREFIESLNSHKVEYVVVGAFAGAHYGVPRYTGDIDILVRPSQENADRVVQTIAEFGFSSPGLTAADFAQPGLVIQLGMAPNRIDLLTSLTGVSFDDVWSGRTESELAGIPVAFIGRDQYIRNKRATGRPQDLADIAALE